KPQRLTCRDLREHVHICTLDADSEETKSSGLLARADTCGSVPPIVVRLAVCDEKDPWPIVGDALLAVQLFTLLDEVEASGNSLAHWGGTVGLQDGCGEVLGRNEVGLPAHGAEGQDCYLHSLGCQSIASELRGERLQASVELVYRLASHRGR